MELVEEQIQTGDPQPGLNEEHRKKLDAIVKQMIDNGETDDDINFVVSDFKKKYSVPSTSQPKAESAVPKPDVNPLELFKQRKLSRETQPENRGYGVGGAAPSPELIAERKKELEDINKKITDAGYDEGIATDLEDLPEGEGISFKENIPALKKLRENDPALYVREIAAMKSKGNLYNAIRDNSNKQQADFDIQDLQHLESKDVRAATRKGIELARTYIKDEDQRNKVIADFVQNKAYDYGIQPLQDDESIQHLNPYQRRAITFLRDVDPGAAKSYERLLASDPTQGWMGSNEADIRRGHELKSRELERLGMGLMNKAYNERLVQLHKKQGNLTPEEKAEYEKLYQEASTLAEDMSSQSQRYPSVAKTDTERFLQESMGSNNSIGKKFALGVGENFDDAINWVGSLIEDKGVAGDLELMGDKEFSSSVQRYNPEDEKLIGSDFVSKFDILLQDKVDAVKNDKKLTEDQKRDKVRQLIHDNPQGVSFAPNDRAGKGNFTAKSIFSTTGNVASDLVSQIAIASLTGGSTASSKLGQLSSLFGSTYATAYNDYYNDALRQNIPNPTQYAITHTTIEAASELINNDFAMVKKIVGGKGTLGKVLANVTEKEWKDIAKKGAFAKLKDASLEAGKKAVSNSFQETVEETAGQVAGNIADEAVFNKETGVGDGVKDTMITTFVGMLPLGLLSLPFNYKNINRNQKYAMYEAGMNPARFLKSIEADLQSGAITPQEAEKRKANVELAAKAVEASGGIRPDGQPMTDNEKTEFAFNQMVLQQIKEQKKNAPSAVKEKLEKEEEKLDKENSDILTKKRVRVVVGKDKEEATEPKEDLSIPIQTALSSGVLKGGDAMMADVALKSGKPEMVNEFYKTVADQALNKVASEATDPQVSMDRAVETFGKEIVDKAIEMFPKSKVNETETTKVPIETEVKGADQETVGEVSKPAKEKIRVTVGKPTEVVSEPVQGAKEFTTKSGKQKLKFENGELTVKDSKTGAEVSPKTKKKAVLEYIDSNDFTQGEVSTAPPEGIKNETELKNHVVETSNNPYELAELYVNEEPTTQPLSTKERMIADFGIGKVKRASYAEFGDRNNIGMSKAKTYFSNEGQSIDVIAKELSDHYGVEIEPSDIIEFIDRFPNGESQALREVESDVSVSAANKFKQLTGIDINNEVAERIVNKEFNKLSKAQQALAEQDYETAQQLQDEYWNQYEQTNGFTEESTDSKVEQTKETGNKIESIEDFEKEFKELLKFNETDASPKLGDAAVSETSTTTDPKEYSDSKKVLSQAKEAFAGDKVIERAISFLEPIIAANPNIKIDTSVRNFNKGEHKGEKLVKGALGYGFSDGTIILNFDKLGGDTKAILSTALHEMMHAATKGELKNNTAFRDALGTVLADIRTALKVPQNSDLISALVAMGAIDENKYGAANEAELIAEVFTNPKFNELLKGIEYKGSNLFDWLIEAILSAFSNAYKGVKEAKKSIGAKDMAEFVMALTEQIATGRQDYKSEASPEIKNTDAFKDLINRSANIPTEKLAETISRLAKISIEDATNLINSVRKPKVRVVVGEPKEEAKETAKEENEVSGIKKALVPESTIANTDFHKVSDRDIMEMGRAILDRGLVEPEKVIRKVVEKGEGVLTPEEVVALVTYKADLDNEIREAYKAVDGKPTGKQQENINDLERAKSDYELMSLITASQQSLAFRLRKMLLDKDYNVTTQIAKYKSNNGGTIPPDVEAKMKQMAKELEAVKDKIAKLEQQQETKEAPVKKSIAQKAIDALDKIQQKLRGKQYSDATGMVAIVDAGITTIKLSIKAGMEIVDAVEAGIKKIKELLKEKGVDVWEKEQEFRQDMIQGFSDEGVEDPSLKAAKTRTRNKITELVGKISTEDFSKKPIKRKIEDSELIELKARKEKIQEEFDKLQYKNALKKRGFWHKVEDIVLEIVSGLPRALVASIDFSAVLVQGLKRLLTSPKQSWVALGDMFKQFASQKEHDNWLGRIKSQSWYPELKKSKLAITDIDGKMEAREEQFISNWVDAIYNGLATILSLGNKKAKEFIIRINPYKATSRAYTGYLNSIRVQGFLEGANYLEKQGFTVENSPEKYQKWADYINTSTGRASLGKAETNSKWLSIFMFAPRKVVSDLKLFTPYAFIYYARMPKYVRKKAVLDYAQFMGTVFAANVLAWAAMRGDDDEEEDNFWNPTSTDFFTHKFGNTRVDVTGGVRTNIVFMWRLFSGTFTDQYGKETKLGDRFGKQINTEWDLIESFFSNKLSPLFAFGKKKLDEKKGLEMDMSEEATNLAIPMWLQDIGDLYRENPTEVAAMFNAMAIFGASVRVSENNSPQVTLPNEVKADFDRTNNDDFLPTSPSTSIEIAGQTVELTDDQKKNLKIEIQKSREVVVQGYMKENREEYEKMSDLERIETLKALYSEGRRRAVEVFKEANPTAVESTIKKAEKEYEDSEKQKKERQ